LFVCMHFSFLYSCSLCNWPLCCLVCS
jgi:hypothetical protein